MTRDSQLLDEAYCCNCEKELAASDRSRNCGTGLCWECFAAHPELWSTAVSGVEVESENEASIVTTVSAARVLRSAADFVLAHSRWETVHETEEQLTLQHVAGASCLTAAVLFLLGGIPGLLYLLLARRESRLTVRATPFGTGTHVNISWADADWRPFAWAFLDTLPEVSEDELRRIREAAAASKSAEPRPPAIEPEEREGVFEQMRQLARLHDDGLITQDEFESKKADLLSRL